MSSYFEHSSDLMRKIKRNLSLPKLLLSEVFTTSFPVVLFNVRERKRANHGSDKERQKRGKKEKWAKQAKLLLFVLEGAVALAFACSHCTLYIQC